MPNGKPGGKTRARCGSLPPADPVDRIMAATARAFGYTLVTRDRRLLDYGRGGHMRAMPC